jgi:hypothetical protein
MNYFDDFLSSFTCEEIYANETISEEEKRAILEEIAREENQATEEDK